MKILLTGVETQNKGAELMLYAILQEIERKYPRAIVYMPKSRIKQGISYVKTGANLKYWPFYELSFKLHLFKIFRSFKLPYAFMPYMISVRDADVFFDASGFSISDQFSISDSLVWFFNKQLSCLKKRGCKIVYLPQAFGPIEKPNTKNVLNAIGSNETLIMPREKVSYKYLCDSGLCKSETIKMYPDFTSLVDGVIPQQYEYLRDGLCVIPNRQMIRKGAVSKEQYIELIKLIILQGNKTKHKVYLLNHEGVMDEKLCIELRKELNNQIEVVTGLNALEVKGLISTAFLVVSSRFHGVASALNTCVPCLATSWSHKYKELFSDYNQTDCILPLNNNEGALLKVEEYLRDDVNNSIRKDLSVCVPLIKEKTRQMWETVWSNI